MTTNAFIEGQTYRSINEDTGKLEPYDDEAPDYDCYQPTETGAFWVCDCWVVDSEGRQHPGYSESAVPVRKGCLGGVVS